MASWALASILPRPPFQEAPTWTMGDCAYLNSAIDFSTKRVVSLVPLLKTRLTGIYFINSLRCSLTVTLKLYSVESGECILRILNLSLPPLPSHLSAPSHTSNMKANRRTRESKWSNKSWIGKSNLECRVTFQVQIYVRELDMFESSLEKCVEEFQVGSFSN